MSRELLAIPTIAAGDYKLAKQAQIGAATRLFYSLGAFLTIGKVEQDAADAGTLTADSTYAAPTDKASGYDMQAVLTAPMKSAAGACLMTFNATFTGGAITSSTSASPGVITTAAAHGLTTADTVDITGVTGSGATGLNGTDVPVTVVSPTTFTVGVNTTGVGSGGSFVKKGTATATFRPPTQATDQSYDLPQGLAVDLVGVGTSSTFKLRSINSLASVTNGGAGVRVDLVSFPSRAAAIEIPGVDDKNPGIPSPSLIAIADTYDATAWLVRGRDTVDEFSFSAKYTGFAEGFARLNGQRVTLFAEQRSDGRLLTQRMVLGGCRGVVSLPSGDGNNEDKATFRGHYESFGVFV